MWLNTTVCDSHHERLFPKLDRQIVDRPMVAAGMTQQRPASYLPVFAATPPSEAMSIGFSPLPPVQGISNQLRVD